MIQNIHKCVLITAITMLTLEFSAGSIMKLYQDDILVDSVNYHIELYANDPDKYELIYGSDLRVLLFLVKDTLILNAAHVDGPLTSYVRIPK